MNDKITLEQQPFGTVSFADNPEPRCPCLLLLDTSGSMSGRPISELNAGLQAFQSELQADSLAMKRVEVALITFGRLELSMSSIQPKVFPVPPCLQLEILQWGKR